MNTRSRATTPIAIAAALVFLYVAVFGVWSRVGERSTLCGPSVTAWSFYDPVGWAAGRTGGQWARAELWTARFFYPLVLLDGALFNRVYLGFGYSTTIRKRP
jgi:hypothetical protein